jgi:3'-phosphoadenosine 5'-phosphosulfate sulfotransferase (PAPS reductase)/FAD synthetase
LLSNPIRHPELHTDVMKTQALRQALDRCGFDAARGGARRDEERSRAKERIFSWRAAPLGPKASACRAMAPLQYAQTQGRKLPVDSMKPIRRVRFIFRGSACRLVA